MLEQFRTLYNKTNIKTKIVLRYSHLNKKKMIKEKINEVISTKNKHIINDLIYNHKDESELLEYFDINRDIKYRHINGSMKKNICDYIRVYINEQYIYPPL
jgi:hypothetical protein